MKVAFIVGAFPSVSETFILNQMAGVLKRGVEIEIHAARPKRRTPIHPAIREYRLLDRARYRPSTPSSGLRMRLMAVWLLIINLPRMKGMLVAYREGRSDPASCAFSYLALAHSLMRSKADVIHAQFGHFGKRVAVLKEAGLIAKPLLTSFRGGDTTIALRSDPEIYRTLYIQGSAFTAVSHFIKNIQALAGCPPDRIQVLHSGIDSTKFRFQSRKRIHRPPTLLVVARLTEVKGVRFAIEAMPQILSGTPECRLMIVGDGEDRPRLEALCLKLGVSGHVSFRGALPSDNVRQAMSAADIFVMPSIRASDGAEEGMPNSLKEAMACGIPVVATRTGGIPELVEDGVSGILVPECDAPALAHAVSQLIQHPEIIPAMAGAARKKIEGEFDIEALNDRLVEMYKELARGGQSTECRSASDRANQTP